MRSPWPSTASRRWWWQRWMRQRGQEKERVQQQLAHQPSLGALRCSGLRGKTTRRMCSVCAWPCPWPQTNRSASHSESRILSPARQRAVLWRNVRALTRYRDVLPEGCRNKGLSLIDTYKWSARWVQRANADVDIQPATKAAPYSWYHPLFQTCCKTQRTTQHSTAHLSLRCQLEWLRVVALEYHGNLGNRR